MSYGCRLADVSDPLPRRTMSVPPVVLPMISRNISRQPRAEFAVLIAYVVPAALIFGRCVAYAGEMRLPAAGRRVSEAADRTVMMPVPDFRGSTKFPVNVAPGCS